MMDGKQKLAMSQSARANNSLQPAVAACTRSHVEAVNSCAVWVFNSTAIPVSRANRARIDTAPQVSSSPLGSTKLEMNQYPLIIMLSCTTVLLVVKTTPYLRSTQTANGQLVSAKVELLE